MRSDKARKIGISEVLGCLRVPVVVAVLVSVEWRLVFRSAPAQCIYILVHVACVHFILIFSLITTFYSSTRRSKRALNVHSRELLLAASLASCELCRSPLSTFILAFPSASNYNYLWALCPSYSTQTNSESLSPSITFNLPSHCVTEGQLSTWVYLSARGHYVIWYLLLSVSLTARFHTFLPQSIYYYNLGCF